MSIHETRQVIEDIRNHLAAHDKRLAFLFGAGTSCAVNVAGISSTGDHPPKHEPLIPAIDGLTKICRAAVESTGDAQMKAWEMLVSQCKGAGFVALQHADVRIEDRLVEAALNGQHRQTNKQCAGYDSDSQALFTILRIHLEGERVRCLSYVPTA
jgi:hypothetical protein